MLHAGDKSGNSGGTVSNNPNQVMLASKVTDVNNLHYPLLVSVKLDGVRAFIRNGTIMSRKYKPIPNIYVQRLFGGLPEGLDGELVLGEPTEKDCYRKTTSAVMGHDNPEGKKVVFHVFDKMTTETETPFSVRLAMVEVDVEGKSNVKVVKQELVYSPEFLLELEAKALAEGHEGLMVRGIKSPYKHGRSTEREGILLKLKRFMDSEAVVTSYVPFMHNINEAQTDELGHTKRSTAKDGKVPLDMLGKLCVRDLKSGVEFEVGTGFTFTEREALWHKRSSLVGSIAKYKYFPSGGKDKPRFPVFLGWRDPIDMD